MKTLLIIILAMAPIIGSAQAFDYSASIEGGYYGGHKSIQGPVEVSESYAGQDFTINTPASLTATLPNPSYYSNLTVGLHFLDRKINFETSVMTVFNHNTTLNFNPTLSMYVTDLYYNPDIPIKIGWRHSCTHTISTKGLGGVLYNSTFDNIYVNLTIKE